MDKKHKSKVIKTPVPESAAPSPMVPEPVKESSRFSKILPWLLVVLAVLSGIIMGCLIWYKVQLSPVDNNAVELKPVTIVAGSTPRQIGELLEEEEIIRSATAFNVHARLSGKQGTLQAGTYRLSPAEATPVIVNHLTLGSVDKFNITFLPGATLNNISDIAEAQRSDIRASLQKAGYTDKEIDKAFATKYDHPVFKDKPLSADLEGYVYGETYSFNSDATVEEILIRTFDELWAVIEENDLINKFKAQELNLHEGLTLASIVQRETRNSEDQKQVAQVFYLRMEIGMPLEADPTYQYIADKTDVPRDTGLDSEYNTRRYKGLPPGPIASPGLNALFAVAEPADSDYLYFVGDDNDDNLTHFARTLEEHEANTARYCAVKCSSL